MQNPKIPERVKTIMEGNRDAFIKKTKQFFSNIDTDYNNYNELIEKCNKVNHEIDSLGKGTARSYQILNEFFAREAENVARNIKNIENYSKDIKNSIKDNKISIINKIKNDIESIKNKIKLKEQYSDELNNENNNLKNNETKKSETEKKINEIKSSSGYEDYRKLLEEKENVKSKLSGIENRIFHDFSVLEKALKKYAKIALENEKLILDYLSNSIITLIKDNELEILKILDSLKNAIDELGLDDKKKEKSLEKIGELDGVYLMKIRDDFGTEKQRLNEITSSIENNESNNELESNNNELNNVKTNIENLNNKISNLNNELEKININKLKENLANEVNDVVNSKIIIS